MQFLSLPYWKRPDNSLRHKQENKVGDDVWNLRAVIKRIGIDAGSFDGSVPEPGHWDAVEYSSNPDAHSPEDNHHAHDIYAKEHPLDGKQALIQSQDGQFDEHHVGSVDQWVCPSDLEKLEFVDK